jgi:carbonic anhydrase
MPDQMKTDGSRLCEKRASGTSSERAMPLELAQQFSRRVVLGGLGAAAALAAMPGARAAFALPSSDDNTAPPVTAGEAMERLKKGNQRFTDGRLSPKTDLVERRKKLVAGQHPFVTILSCSDSRVPPELVFDQSLGDIFLIRVAGNIVDTDVLGSIEYSVLHLKVPLLFVVGHQKCGAVDAALAEMQGHANEPENITALLRKIIPGLKGVDLKLPPDQLLQAAVEANIRYTAKQLREAPEIKRFLDKQKLGLVSGVYDLASGSVRMMEQSIPA